MNELSAKKSFLAGGVAGLSSAVILQPFDLLKTRLQQQQQQIAGYDTTLVNELKKLKHFKELWRGVLPSTLRTSIGSGIYLTLLSKSRYYLASLKNYTQQSTELTSSQLPKLSPIENLSTGFVVRAIAGIVTMPITIVKTRFESNLYNYNSMYEGIESIYLSGSATGGKSLLNFFKGTSVTLARDCPYAGLYVLFYESFKIDFSRLFLKENDETIASAINSGSAILAASMATTITAPFDTIKTRLQLAKAHSNSGIWQTSIAIVSEPGGVSNLFKGLSLRLGRKALSAGISWCIYEELIKYL